MTTLQTTTWHGRPAWALENDTLRTVVVPEMGAKLVSLLDKRTRLEWLVGPGDRPFQRAAYGSVFTEQDMSGWDEMFPTINACAYPGPGDRHGVSLPDHGEVWALPWTVEPAEAGKLACSVQGQALPYRIQRTVFYSQPDTLQLDYQLWNLGQDRLPYMWAAHPQFATGAGVRVVLPPQVDEVCNTLPAQWGWGEPETRFAWPVATAPDASRLSIDRVGPACLHKARKFFAPPETHLSWCALVRQPGQDWLRMDWEPEKVPYFGLWVDEGAISPQAVAAPEPTTGYYDSLVTACQKNQVIQIEAGESHSWTLSVRFGTGSQPLPA